MHPHLGFSCAPFIPFPEGGMSYFHFWLSLHLICKHQTQGSVVWSHILLISQDCLAYSCGFQFAFHVENLGLSLSFFWPQLHIIKTFRWNAPIGPMVCEESSLEPRPTGCRPDALPSWPQTILMALPTACLSLHWPCSFHFTLARLFFLLGGFSSPFPINSSSSSG